MFGRVLSGVALAALLLPGLGWARSGRVQAAPPSWVHEICRVHHDRTECVKWTADCSRGEDTAGGHATEPARCRGLVESECRGLGKLFGGAVDDVREFPASERTEDRLVWSGCDGFMARSGPKWIAACFGRHAAGTDLLSSVFKAAIEVCDARP